MILGLAFLFIEIAFIQKLLLFLHHPLYAIAVVLSSFLVFSGLGSAWLGQLQARGTAVDGRRLYAGPFAPSWYLARCTCCCLAT